MKGNSETWLKETVERLEATKIDERLETTIVPGENELACRAAREKKLVRKERKGGSDCDAMNRVSLVRLPD